jgi:hypothetical protein
MLKVCDPSSQFAKYIPGGTIEGKVEGDGLINFNKHVSAAYLQQVLIAGTLIRMMIDVAGVSYEYEGYVNSISITGANKAAASFTYAFTISGPVAIDDTAEKDPGEIGSQNLLLVGPGDEPLDINDIDNNLII